MKKNLPLLSLLLIAAVSHADLQAIRTLQPDQGMEVRRPAEAQVFGTPKAEHAELEKELLDIYTAKETTAEGRKYSCRMLRFCASEASVSVLAPSLKDPKLSGHVRLVLQGVESETANKALIQALSKIAHKDIKIGIIGTLGQRGSEASIPAVAPYLKKLDVELQRAAIIALGNIGGMDANRALAKAKARPDNVADWKMAQIQSANELETKHALKVLSQFTDDDNEDIAIAVFVGTVRADPISSAEAVITAISSSEGRRKSAAIELLPIIPTDALLQALPSAVPESQIRLMAELVSRNAEQAEPAILGLTDSADAAVRDAALDALGQIGGAASVSKLMLTMPTNDHAYTAMCALKSTEADTALLAALKSSADDKQRVKLIEAVVARKCTAALPVLIELAKGDWSRTTASAINGMSALATESDFETYAQLMLATDNKKKISALEKSIALAAQRQVDADTCAGYLSTAVEQAQGEAAYALVRSLGSIGGETARGVLTESLSSEDPLVMDAALRGLSNWPTIDVADQLLELAQTAESEKHRVIALRGYIRLSSSLYKEPQVLDMCEKARAITDRPAELKRIISAANRFKSKNVIAFITPLLDNSDVVNEAGWALLNQSRHWEYGPITLPALKITVEKTTDEKLRADTQKRINELEK